MAVAPVPKVANAVSGSSRLTILEHFRPICRRARTRLRSALDVGHKETCRGRTTTEDPVYRVRPGISPKTSTRNYNDALLSVELQCSGGQLLRIRRGSLIRLCKVLNM